MDILEVLKELDIEYEIQEHKAVYTVDDLQDVFLEMEGIGCKNLFLKDAKKNLFLYTLPDNKRADLKTLPEKINSKRLSFANENDLQEYLGLTPGSVTPLGMLNDKEMKVKLFIDKEFIESSGKIGVHPNDNTATVWLKIEDLINIIKEHGNEVEIVEI